MKKELRKLLCVATVVGTVGGNAGYSEDLTIDTAGQTQAEQNKVYENLTVTETGGLTITGETTVENVFSNSGALTNEAAVSVSNSTDTVATLTNNYAFANNSTGSIVAEAINNVAGNFTNSGKIGETTAGTLTNSAIFENVAGGLLNATELTNRAGAFTNKGELNALTSITNNAAFRNEGKIGETTAGSIENTSVFENIAGAALNATTVSNSTTGAFTNSGVLNAADAITNAGAFTNSGDLNATTSITNNNTFKNSANSTVDASSIVNATGNFINEGTIGGTAAGAIKNSAVFENAQGAVINATTVANSGTFTNAGATTSTDVTNSGAFKNDAGAVLESEKFTNETGSFVNEGTSTIKELVNNAVLENAQGAVINATTVANSGTYTNAGDLNATTSITNTGALKNDAGATLDTATLTNTSGTFTNLGTIGGTAAGAIKNSAVFENAQGAVINATTVANSGTFTNAGATTSTDVTNSGAFKNNAGAVLESEKFTNETGSFVNEGTSTIKELVNNAVLENAQGAVINATTVANSGTYTNKGDLNATTSITNTGAFKNDAGATLDTATLTNASGTFTNLGTIGGTAAGAIENSAVFENAQGAIVNTTTVANSGTYTNKGDLNAATSITNTGAFKNDAGATLDTAKLTNTSGTFTNVGTATITDVINNAVLENEQGAALSATTIINNAAGTFTNSGAATSTDVINSGAFKNGAGATLAATKIENSAGANFTNLGETSASTSVTNNGVFTNEAGANLDSALITNESGAFTNHGYIGATTVGDVVNKDAFLNTGSIAAVNLNNSGNFTNNGGASILANYVNNTAGTFTNLGSIGEEGKAVIELNNTATFANAGSIVAATVANSGDFTNNGGATILANNVNNTAGSFINLGAIGEEGKAVIELNNAATFANAGSIVAATVANSGDFTNNGGASILTNDINNTAGSFTNFGAIGKEGGAVNNIINNAEFDNAGSIVAGLVQNNGANADFTNWAGGTILGGTVDNTQGSFTNLGKIGDTDKAVYLVNNADKFANAGSIVAATVANSGDFTNNGEASILTNDINNTAGSFTNLGAIGKEGGAVNNIVNSAAFDNVSSIVAVNITNDNDNSAFTNHASGTILASKVDNQKGSFINLGAIGEEGKAVIELNNAATFANAGSIVAATVANSGDFTNNGGATILANNVNNTAGSFINLGAIGEEGKAVIELNNAATFANADSIVAGLITNTATFTNEATGEILATTVNNNAGTLTNLGNIGVEGKPVTTVLNESAATLDNSGTIYSTNFTNKGSVLDSAATGVLYVDLGDNSGTLVQSIINITKTTDPAQQHKFVNTNSVTAGDINIGDGSLYYADGAASVTTAQNININTASLYHANNASTTTAQNIVNDGEIRLNNGSAISVEAQKAALGGLINVQDGTNTLSVIGSDIVSEININAGNNTALDFVGGTIANDAKLTIAENTTLNIKGQNSNTANVRLNDLATDNWLGTINLETDGTLTLDAYNKEITGNVYYNQNGGALKLTNGSTFTMTDAQVIKGGDMDIDSASQFVLKSDAAGGIAQLDNLNHSGTIHLINQQRGVNNVANINVGAQGDMSPILLQVDNQADFTVDVYARSNAASGSDQFVGKNITGLQGSIIHIADWDLNGEILGADAPIDRDIALNIFDYKEVSPNVLFTSTQKEIFTPIGWYQLMNRTGTANGFTASLSRFNPQVYRGQVTTVAQLQNQLAIADMLFTHATVLPSFKEEEAKANSLGTMANKYAAINPAFAPYQYTRKEGGLWYKAYGNFENLQMNQPGLGKVHNNAYGALIGADFGVKELSRGWNFVPTAYIGYNGAHQAFQGVSAYQNGAQAGFMGTWNKDAYLASALIYGGVYNNAIKVAGHSDDTFNYFAGLATKQAYNWRLHNDFVLQPNLMLAYNYFGQQNWHTGYGQMGMMSGMLNGVNIAPGLNFIWEKDTFSAYLTLQYMYNANGAVGGRAGNVNLPHVYMDRGYIQYGVGATKKLSDRFSGYAQAVLRNVGRTGCGFQAGINMQLGK